ncbi:MAG: hypothetical protein ABI047_02125 [Jatrophihabitantaceae bacterium]
MMLLTLRQIYQGQGPVTDFSSTLQIVKVARDNTMQLLVNTNRDASAANAEVSTLFKTYYAELKKATSGVGTERVKRREKTGPSRPAGSGAACRSLLSRREWRPQHNGAAQSAAR